MHFLTKLLLCTLQTVLLSRFGNYRNSSLLSCILKSHPLKWTKAEAIWKSLIPTQLKRLRWLHLFLWEKQTLLFRKGRRAIVHLPQLSAGRRQRKHEGMPGSSKNTTWSEPLNFSHFFGNLLIWCTLHLTVRTTSRFCQKTQKRPQPSTLFFVIYHEIV